MVNEAVAGVPLSVTELGDTARVPGDGGGECDGLGDGLVRPGVGDERGDGCPCPTCPPCPPCEGVGDGESDTVMVRPMCCLPPRLPDFDGEGVTPCCEPADSGGSTTAAGPTVAALAAAGP